MTQQFHSWVYIKKQIENANLKSCMHSNVHSSIVYNCQDIEAKQMSTDTWMDNEGVVRIYNEILLSLKMNEIMDGPRDDHTK